MKKKNTPMMTHITALWAGSVMLSLAACQETPFEEPPIHPNLNMDFQSSFKPQEENDFFADKRAMRPQVAGTVAKGQLKEDQAYYTGKSGDAYVTKLSVPLTMSLLKRGEERFNIYCTPCHGYTGKGDGAVIKRNAGMVQPPNFHEDRVLQMPIGQYFEAMTQGVRTMPSYKAMIPAEDRWAIAAYMRALQLSYRSGKNNVPAETLQEKGWAK